MLSSLNQKLIAAMSSHWLSTLPFFVFAFGALLVNTDSASAQPVRLQTTLDTNRIKIGERARYTITATHDTNTVLKWPKLTDTLQDLEIVNKSTIDTSIRGNVINKRQTIGVTSFDSGYYVIPPVRFLYRTKGIPSFDSVKTEPTTLRVKGVAVDTSQAIRPIAGIRDVPYTLAELWPYILGGLLIIGLIILGYYLYKRWKQQPEKPAKEITKPERPAHELAFEKLQQLENKKLWQSGEIKQYYIELSDIFREYLERRYRFQALESTTGEIVSELKEHIADPGLRTNSQEVLELADFVKFAKYVPQADENQEVLQKTHNIINETKMKPQTAQEQQENGGQETDQKAEEDNNLDKQ